MTKIVIHVPHASTAIPADVWAEFTVSRQDVEAEAFASADLYTNEIARQAWPHAEIIEAEVSRIIVDVERYDDDSSEEMAEVGRGVMYTCDHLMRPIRKTLSGPRREELLARYYRPHWERLRAQAANAILVDLHTYPLTPLSWITALTEHFQKIGYEVGHNTPYVGVIDAGAKAAVMIEIRRDIVGLPGVDPKWQRLIAALSTMPSER
jgi:predicted N-formylglutamate amidohydrolase